MLLASGILALLCAGYAVEALLMPDGSGREEPDADVPTPEDGPMEENILSDLSGEALRDPDLPDGWLLPASHEEMIEGWGVVTVIEDFRPGVDRLLLDFDPDQPLPEVTLNAAVEPGSTAVMGDGALMVVLRGIEGVRLADVQLRAVDGPDDWAEDGGTEDDIARARAGMADALGDADAVTGSAGADGVAGGAGSEAIFGDAGPDILLGGGGADEIYGGTGDDVAAGGTGGDLVDGGEGADSVYGGTGDDAVFGGAGDDLLAGDAGADTLQGGFGADTLRGGDGADMLDGTFAGPGPFDTDRDAADTLDGGAGDDRILAGTGDLALGGEGADTVAAIAPEVISDPDGTIEGAEGEVPFFADFDPEADVIEVLYDAAEERNPWITVEDFEDGTGATVLLGGRPVLAVAGAQGLDPAAVVLVPR